MPSVSASDFVSTFNPNISWVVLISVIFLEVMLMQVLKRLTSPARRHSYGNAKHQWALDPMTWVVVRTLDH